MSITDTALDQILALQLTVAWAGEGLCRPPRLGWWRTDLVDEAGGGDLFARLLPKTHLWASLEAVRWAAIHADRRGRAQVANPDSVRTLFHFGFTVDEMIEERLRTHKHAVRPPGEALPLPMDIRHTFSPGVFEQGLRLSEGSAQHQVVPSGRQMKGEMPSDPARAAQCLAAALLPLSERYPLPFYHLPSHPGPSHPCPSHRLKDTR